MPKSETTKQLEQGVWGYLQTVGPEMAGRIYKTNVDGLTFFEVRIPETDGGRAHTRIINAPTLRAITILSMEEALEVARLIALAPSPHHQPDRTPDLREIPRQQQPDITGMWDAYEDE